MADQQDQRRNHIFGGNNVRREVCKILRRIGLGNSVVEIVDLVWHNLIFFGPFWNTIVPIVARLGLPKILCVLALTAIWGITLPVVIYIVFKIMDNENAFGRWYRGQNSFNPLSWLWDLDNLENLAFIGFTLTKIYCYVYGLEVPEYVSLEVLYIFFLAFRHFKTCLICNSECTSDELPFHSLIIAIYNFRETVRQAMRRTTWRNLAFPWQFVTNTLKPFFSGLGTSINVCFGITTALYGVSWTMTVYFICRYVEGVDLIKPRKPYKSSTLKPYRPYKSIIPPMSADRYEKFLVILFTLFKIHCYVNGLHELNSRIEFASILYPILTRLSIEEVICLKNKRPSIIERQYYSIPPLHPYEKPLHILVMLLPIYCYFFVL